MKSISKYLINENEIIKYSHGYKQENDTLSSTSLIITNRYIYFLGKFLIRDTKMMLNESDGLKVLDISSINAITMISKKNPIFLSISIITLILLILVPILADPLIYIVKGSTESIQIVLFFSGIIFLLCYFLVRIKMLNFEYSGGELFIKLN